MPITPAAIHVQPRKLPTSIDYVCTLNSTFLVLLEWYRSRYNKLLTYINIVYMPGIWTSYKGNSINLVTVHTCTSRENVILELDQAYCHLQMYHIYRHFLSQYLQNIALTLVAFTQTSCYCPFWRQSKQNTTWPKHTTEGPYVAEARKSHLFDCSTHSDFCTDTDILW
jgi:hypothetical protein